MFFSLSWRYEALRVAHSLRLNLLLLFCENNGWTKSGCFVHPGRGDSNGGCRKWGNHAEKDHETGLHQRHYRRRSGVLGRLHVKGHGDGSHKGFFRLRSNG